MFENVLLTPGQQELFTKLVEAASTLTGAQREPFKLWTIRGDGQVIVQLMHPGIKGEDGKPYRGDIDVLRVNNLISWDEQSPDLTQFDITPFGYRYYEHLRRPPQYSAQQQLQRVVGVIARHQQARPNHFTNDTTIADELGMDIHETRAYMDELHALGMTMKANTLGGHAAMLKGKGVLAAKDPNYFQQTSNTTINYSGNFQGAIVNINSTLSSVTQTISGSPKLDQTAKDELAALVQQLNTALQQAPADKSDEAETVADFAKDLIENATKDKPNKTKMAYTADNLKKAAENLATVIPTVLPVAIQIAERINAL